MCKFPLIIHGEVVFDVDLSQLQNGFFTVATSSCQCFDLESSKLHMTQLLLLGKFEYNGGPIFKVVLEC